MVGVVDYASRTVKIYVDGHQEQKLEFDGTYREYNTNQWRIGAEAPGGANRGPADALIDDVSIWNLALSSSEISTIYNRQKQHFASHYDSDVVDGGALRFDLSPFVLVNTSALWQRTGKRVW